jgi:hypothetical protein
MTALQGSVAGVILLLEECQVKTLHNSYSGGSINASSDPLIILDGALLMVI